MPTRVSYEPSIQSLAADLLPGATIVSQPDSLRNRVSWPVIVRATGLGRLEGGELVLVPRVREESVLAHLGNLAAVGVSGVVLSGPLSPDAEALTAPGIPVVLPAAEVELRRLREEIERYVARRRRELFAVDQEMHRTIVDAAISGASLQRLVDITHDTTQRPVVLDRGGDVLVAGAASESVAPRLLTEVRLAVRDGSAAAVLPGESQLVLAMPVVAGGLRRGIAFLMQVRPSTMDEDEIALAALASSAAIAAGREPDYELPSREEALGSNAVLAVQSEVVWTGFAVDDLGDTPEHAARALSSELEARTITHVLARDGVAVVGLVAADPAMAETLLQSASRRSGAEQIRAGVSRPYKGADGAGRAMEEALRALDLGDPGITRFEEVELTALLADLPRKREYAEGRLRPLIDRPDLLRTLEIYLESGRKVGEAAAELHIHRNTLNYRLARIRELLGVDPDERETAFGLQLALRVLSQEEKGGSVPHRSRP